MKAGPSIKRRDNELPGRADQTNELEQGKRREREKINQKEEQRGSPTNAGKRRRKKKR